MEDHTRGYEFSRARIARWTEKVGVDIRPPIEIGLEEERLQTFSKWARKEYPQLFDRVVLGDQRFEMLKTLEYPGKPPVDVATFAMTARGPVFTVPVRISEVDLEPDLPKINDVFGRGMKQLLSHLPGRRVIRVGKVNEYIFACEETPSLALVVARFSRLTIPEGGELFLRFNLPDENFNRIFTIQPVEARRLPGPHAPPEHVGFGVGVTVDVNNRDLSKGLSEPNWMTVLHAADVFNRDEVYDILNSVGEDGEP